MTQLGNGDRVLVRDRPWRVASCRSLGSNRLCVSLDALDGEAPFQLEVLSPPDHIERLPPISVTLEPRELDSFSSWSAAHRILATGLVRETGLLSGARFGRVALEPFQLAPVLRVLSKTRPSLLIADDVGLGKTIEAGLILLELMARGRARRVLVVAPPGLLDQWRDELRERFALDFVVLDNAAGVARAQTELPAGVNPWDALPRVLTSIDFLKRDTVRRRALRKRWDLAIVDEAHALAESGTSTNPYRTQRHRLGEALRDSARGIVLLTATPHNGYPHSFRSLLELVDPTLATFEGSWQDVERRIESARIRRMKRQIRRHTERGEEAVFPERHVAGIPVRSGNDQDRDLLLAVSQYCAGAARAARGTDEEDLVTFAMQIVKKRALSSRRALERTVGRRLEALQKVEAREPPPERSELRDLQSGLPLPEETAERTAERVLRSAIPADEKRRKSEVRALTGIRKRLRALPERDPKLEAAVAEIQRVLADDPSERIIVFTEYVDTLEALIARLEAEEVLHGRIAVLRGGLTRRQRAQRQSRFEEEDVRVLLATDAASEGLNLQRRCRRILHVELPWNPNRLEQRNGRVDRYGQTREPEIRYLFFPDSPEEHVLDQLVAKVERMQRDRISTPDVLGAWAGEGLIERRLTELGEEGSDLAARMAALVRTFDDRTAELLRDVQPFVAAGPREPAEMQRILGLLDRADPLLADGEALERAVHDTLGPRALAAGARAGTLRIDVPLAFRGPSVLPTYPAATFDRNLAARTPSVELELITPFHPLVAALRGEARRRLVQVYADSGGIRPRRLAARRVPATDPPSVAFTFLAGFAGGGDLVEEHLLAVRVATDCSLVGDPLANLDLLASAAPGEVDPLQAVAVVGPTFSVMTAAAARAAAAWASDRAEALRGHRRAQAEALRRDLETDLADRLREIDREESRARTTVDPAGQFFLFEAEEARATPFAARRQAAQAQTEARQGEILAYEAIDDPLAPMPLGALILLPEEQS